MSKTVEETLLGRRSIRRYEYQRIPWSDIEFIHEAIRNSPTSYNGQQFSVIDIDDPELKAKLYNLTGQKQIKTCGHFMLFCADFNKLKIISAAKSLPPTVFTATADGYTVGVIDASLALMSAIAAAESRGLGTCPVGYIRTAAPAAVCRLLNLPGGVAPVCGLAIGVPRELPDMKPKQPVPLLVHRNGYRTDDMLPDLLAYDREISAYNRTRSGSTSENDWAGHIVGYYSEGESYNTLAAMRAQGFLTADR